LTLPEFGELIHAVHRRPPYAWQERAARELSAEGWWPALRAPTGAGKTTLIDCWLYAVARAGPDQLGRRLVWVVDRRAVVDQVFAYAEQVLARMMAPAAAAPAREVAAALAQLGQGRPPRAVLWRGGLDDEAAIALREPLDPAAVAVLVATVDQLGSRLLFRGYGLGVGSRALHAGLLGIDTTIVLDEAHMAEPLRATVRRVAEVQSSAPASPRPPVRLCAVSATLAAPDAFELSDAELAQPAIAKRAGASKWVGLADRGTPKAVAGLASELASGEAAKVIGIVMNTVAEARAVFEALGGLAPEPLLDRVLLIGPVRPLDRIDLLEVIPGRPERLRRQRPFVVVATQTIEVGVDLDFDALITACAPLDALVQRFGRLDRAGALGSTQAFVLAPPVRRPAVYGETAALTWSWLQERAAEGSLDFGVNAMREAVASHGSPPPEVPPRTIALLDLHVHALEVTDASDHEGPSVPLLLHGDRRPTAEVAVAWRRLVAGGGDVAEPSVEEVALELELRPLHPAEIVTISLVALRRWLSGASAGTLSDVESAAEDERQSGDPRHTLPIAWRIDASGGIERIEPDTRVGPSDRIVVRASSGGLDQFGWAPDSTRPVLDLGSVSARGPRLVIDSSSTAVAAVADRLAAGEMTATAGARALGAEIMAALPVADGVRPAFSGRVEAVHAALSSGRATLLDDGRILVIARGARSEQGSTGGLVTLDEHQRAVEQRVAEVASALGLAREAITSIQRAARHHDEGKRDPRFQEWLHGGSPGSEVLAKSAYPFNPARSSRLRESSGWPAGKRHELASAAAFARAAPEDRLARWLVVTHHGRNRPFVSAVLDGAQLEFTALIGGQQIQLGADAHPSLGSQLELLSDLSHEHGPWGLAFLEAIVIGADRTVSAAEAGQ